MSSSRDSNDQSGLHNTLTKIDKPLAHNKKIYKKDIIFIGIVRKVMIFKID